MHKQETKSVLSLLLCVEYMYMHYQQVEVVMYTYTQKPHIILMDFVVCVPCACMLVVFVLIACHAITQVLCKVYIAIR